MKSGVLDLKFFGIVNVNVNGKESKRNAKAVKAEYILATVYRRRCYQEPVPASSFHTLDVLQLLFPNIQLLIFDYLQSYNRDNGFFEV